MTLRSAAQDRLIRVRGARTNNLKGIDLDIPKRSLVVFTGVSGSGKSSLAFDTVAAESQRLLAATFPASVQNLVPQPPRPDVVHLEHLTAAIVVNQAPMIGNSRSTVGTATDATPRLRSLFAHHGTPAVAGPQALSFNDPAGMCPECSGSGEQADLDLDLIIDRSRSLNQGAITFPNFAVDSLFWKVYARSGHFANDRPVQDYTAADLAMLLTGTGPNVETGSYPMAYEGVLTKIRRLYLSRSLDALPARIRDALQRCARVQDCAACGGSRLNNAARGCHIAGMSIADVTAMSAVELGAWLTRLDLPPSTRPVMQQLVSIGANMERLGLGYLRLDRPTATLSGGEAQRIRTVTHLDSPLCELTYVFDEPTAGLHPHDTARLIELLCRLRDRGNHVLVVEHHPDVIAAADHIVDLGPGAGHRGGEIVFAGTPAQLMRADTVTAQHLNRTRSLRENVRTPIGQIRVEHTTRNNLRGLSLDIPLGVLVAVTGVAGAGKTSLLDSLPRTEEIAHLDQTPIRGSRRSTPATYSGVMDHIRKQFATANHVSPTLFSPNSTGGCQDCTGLGVTFTTTPTGETLTTRCQTCEGRRFTADVLTHTLDGHTIADVLDLSIDQARDLFTDVAAIITTLDRLHRVGLGYLTLGQPLSQLSGGERQRLRLAIEMGRTAPIYVLDEPTNGLHPADIDTLVDLLDELIDDGTTVIVAEHNRDLIARADWVIDLGPDAGQNGGDIVFQGTPCDLMSATTHTGRALKHTHQTPTTQDTN
ncbi:ATP-binding cassette domain-containing protein [Nocardioides aurantiacus]|uniref:UvrABC system protein A n=1 Tax=Nocardioides aurantiacus TaxID=86796 RepID=A0A3N2CUA9_9ACTN|nr:excinuclease ABC subunit UvrA [Nocardioides aurantiacus]ROR91091.1 excinuclease UvrABC ATPase subunit [Nocardioides aurantiacus]